MSANYDCITKCDITHIYNTVNSKINLGKSRLLFIKLKPDMIINTDNE